VLFGETRLPRTWHRKPSILLPDRLHELEANFPVTIAETKAALTPSQLNEGVEALQALATRRGYDQPEGIAFEMDVEVLEASGDTGVHKLWRGISTILP
jgi:hypothetical protein